MSKGQIKIGNPLVQRPLNDNEEATHPASTMSSQSFWQSSQLGVLV